MIWCLIFLANVGIVNSVLPRYLPSSQENYERDDLIVKYFHLGLKYSEILLFLASSHGIQLSLRQLKRVLTKRGFGRRKMYSSTDNVIQAVEKELNGSGNSIGYRTMHQRHN